MTVSRRSFLTGAASTAALAASGGVGAVAIPVAVPDDWSGWSDRTYAAYLRHMMDHLCRSVDVSYDELTEDWRRSQSATRAFLEAQQRAAIRHWVMPSRTGCTTLEEARAKYFVSETIAIEDHTDHSEIDPGRVGPPEPEAR